VRVSATEQSLFWYAYGPQGETRQLVNAGGAVADSYTYSPYGYATAVSGTDPNPFQFGGSVGDYSDFDMAGLMLCRRYGPSDLPLRMRRVGFGWEVGRICRERGG